MGCAGCVNSPGVITVNWFGQFSAGNGYECHFPGAIGRGEVDLFGALFFAQQSFSQECRSVIANEAG